MKTCLAYIGSHYFVFQFMSFSASKTYPSFKHPLTVREKDASCRTAAGSRLAGLSGYTGGGENFPGFFLLGQLISLVKFREICSAYPLNAPAAVRHAAPHFELRHTYVLLINLPFKVNALG